LPPVGAHICRQQRSPGDHLKVLALVYKCAAKMVDVELQQPIERPAAGMHRGRYRKASAGMDDEPREQISELEVQIEELTDALERCRKTALASKVAMASAEF
jgi:hypothetical protein